MIYIYITYKLIGNKWYKLALDLTTLQEDSNLDFFLKKIDTMKIQTLISLL